MTGYFSFLSVSFSVLGGASGPFSVSAVASLVDSTTFPLATAATVLFADARDGWLGPGQVTVKVPGLAGIYAVSGAPNLLAVSGLPQLGNDSMAVWGTYATSRTVAVYQDALVSPQSCTAAGSQLAAAPASGGCAVTAASAGASVAVTAALSGMSVAASYRVYAALSIAAQATRTTLRRLGADFESGYVTVRLAESRSLRP